MLIEALDRRALDALAELLGPRLAPQPPAEHLISEWLNAKGAAAHMGLSVNALHKLTAARLIPFHQDAPNCKLWFRREELDSWRAHGGARRWLA